MCRSVFEVSGHVSNCSYTKSCTNVLQWFFLINLFKIQNACYAYHKAFSFSGVLSVSGIPKFIIIINFLLLKWNSSHAYFYSIYYLKSENGKKINHKLLSFCIIFGSKSQTKYIQLFKSVNCMTTT